MKNIWRLAEADLEYQKIEKERCENHLFVALKNTKNGTLENAVLRNEIASSPEFKYFISGMHKIFMRINDEYFIKRAGIEKIAQKEESNLYCPECGVNLSYSNLEADPNKLSEKDALRIFCGLCEEYLPYEISDRKNIN